MSKDPRTTAPPARRGPRNKRWQPPEAEWEKHKEAIRLHYMTQNNRLTDTISHMESQGFRASRKMYKDWFTTWGFRKNNTKDEALHLYNESKRTGLRPFEVQDRNMMVPEAKLMRSLKRHLKDSNTRQGMAELKETSSVSSSSSTLPSVCSQDSPSIDSQCGSNSELSGAEKCLLTSSFTAVSSAEHIDIKERTSQVICKCAISSCKAPSFLTQNPLDPHKNVYSLARPYYCSAPMCPQTNTSTDFKGKNEDIQHDLVHIATEAKPTTTDKFWDWCETDAVKTDPRYGNDEGAAYLISDATKLCAAGNFVVAEHYFRLALSTCRRRDSSEDILTLQIAQGLASFYAYQCRVFESKKVISWVLSRQKELRAFSDWGLCHPNTVSSVAEMVRRFCYLESYREAVGLMKSYLLLMQCLLDAPCNLSHYDADRRSARLDAGYKVYPLSNLLWYCLHHAAPSQDDYFAKISGLVIETWCSLLAMHQRYRPPEPRHTVVKGAFRMMIQIFEDQMIPLTPELLKLARATGDYYLLCVNIDAASEHLRILAVTLEERASVDSIHIEGLWKTASFLMTVTAYQEYRREGCGWAYAGPWIERACNLGVTDLNKRSLKKERLREMVESGNKAYLVSKFEQWSSEQG